MNRFYQKEVESTTEYILPDYLGDVKKVLSVSASAIPSGKFSGDGNIEFSGEAVFDVLYADTDGELASISVSSDYGFSVPMPEEGYLDCAAVPRVTNSSVRFTGPRKLVAKALVASSVSLMLESDHTVKGDAFDGDNSPEIDTASIREEHMLFAASAEREYAEEAERLPGVSSDGIDIIVTSGSVRILESIAEEGGVRVKGELVITSIIRTDEQPPFAVRKSIPFEELITLEGATPDMQTVANGYLTSVRADVAEDAEGTLLTVNVIAEYNCLAAQNNTVSVISDAYLTTRDTEAKYENYTYPELLAMGNTECEISLSASRADIGIEDVRDVILVSAEPQHIEKKLGSRSFVISGDAAVSGVANQISEDGRVKYIPFKFTSPFSAEVNTSCQIPENAVLEFKASAVDNRQALDSDSLTVKCTLSVTYHAYVEPCIQKMSECKVLGDAEYEDSGSVVTVYYPDANERLFDIAKRYHTTVGRIAACSGIAAETLASGSGAVSGAKRLIIK